MAKQKLKLTPYEAAREWVIFRRDLYQRIHNDSKRGYGVGLEGYALGRLEAFKDIAKKLPKPRRKG